MENRPLPSAHRSILVRLQVVHLGKILFNWQFMAVAIMTASILSFIVPAIYYILLLSALFFSFFLLLTNDTYRSLWSGGEKLTQITEVLAHSWQYTLPAVAILAVATIVCLSFDRTEKHLARKTVSAIFGVLAIAILVLKAINAGGAA